MDVELRYGIEEIHTPCNNSPIITGNFSLWRRSSG